MFRIVDLVTGETLLENNQKVSVGIYVGEHERVVVTAHDESITTYLRDPVRGRDGIRADIKTIRSGYGLQNRMEI